MQYDLQDEGIKNVGKILVHNVTDLVQANWLLRGIGAWLSRY